MPSSPLETVRRLLALATNEGAAPEEARTAAVKACKLIIENRLLVDEEPPTGTRSTVFESPSEDAFWTELFSALAREQTQRDEQRTARGQTRRPAGPPPARKPPEHTVANARESRPRERYPNAVFVIVGFQLFRCAACRQNIQKGTSAYVYNGMSWHQGCY